MKKKKKKKAPTPRGKSKLEKIPIAGGCVTAALVEMAARVWNTRGRTSLSLRRRSAGPSCLRTPPLCSTSPAVVECRPKNCMLREPHTELAAIPARALVARSKIIVPPWNRCSVRARPRAASRVNDAIRASERGGTDPPLMNVLGGWEWKWMTLSYAHRPTAHGLVDNEVQKQGASAAFAERSNIKTIERSNLNAL